MPGRTVFSIDGLNIGKHDRNLSFIYGLSDFWTYMFEDSEKIELLLEATSQKLSDTYSKFLQLASTISIADMETATHQQLKLVLINADDTVDGKVNTFKLPETILSSRLIANRPFLPTAYLEEGVHYYISTDGTEIQFSEPLSSVGFATRLAADGSKEYAAWFIDTIIDESFLFSYYGNLIGASPSTSTDTYKNFIYGLYYLYTNGPNLALIRKGLNLALGIPLARETETVLEIRTHEETGRYVVITDLNSYLIPYGLVPSVVAGDTLVATQELAQWVEVKDWVDDGDWWINLAIPSSIMPYIPSGQTSRYATPGSYADYVMRNFLKKHTFLINVKTIDFKNLQSFEELSSIISKVKPAYTSPIYIWTVPTAEDDISLGDGDFSLRWDQFRCENLSAPITKMIRNLFYPTKMGTDKHAEITVSANTLSYTGSGTARAARAELGKSSGSWYFEVLINKYTTGTITIGVGTSGAALTGAVGTDAFGWGYVNTALKRNNNSTSSYGATYTKGDYVSVMYDATGDTITFYKNGVSQTQAYTGVSGTLFPMISFNDVGTSLIMNFGGQAFSAAPTSTANPGVYTPGTYLTRGCPQFTRYDVPYWIAAQTGGVSQINGDARPYIGATVTAYINSIAQFRKNTYEEKAWLRTFLERELDAFRLPRNSISFDRGLSYYDNSGVIAQKFIQFDHTQRVIFLYATTQADLQAKFASTGNVVPPLSKWTFSLFQPYNTGFGVNDSTIDENDINSGTTHNFFGALFSTFNTFFFRGTDVTYLRAFMPKEGYNTWAPVQGDLMSLDYLFFIRVLDDIVGVYWVTSNETVHAPNYWIVKNTDGLVTSAQTVPFNRGIGYHSAATYLRGCAVDTGGGVFVNTYTDQVNTTPITLDRSGKIIKIQRDWY